MKTISLRLPDEVYEKLQLVADRAGIAPAVLARSYVKVQLEGRDVDEAMRVARAYQHPIDELVIPGVGKFVRRGDEASADDPPAKASRQQKRQQKRQYEKSKKG